MTYFKSPFYIAFYTKQIVLKPLYIVKQEHYDLVIQREFSSALKL